MSANGFMNGSMFRRGFVVTTGAAGDFGLELPVEPFGLAAGFARIVSVAG